MEFPNRRQINQSEMARQLGISKTYLHLILTGKRKSSHYSKLIKEYLKNLSGRRA